MLGFPAPPRGMVPAGVSLRKFPPMGMLKHDRVNSWVRLKPWKPLLMYELERLDKLSRNQT
jgi:hypothetical protein